MARVKSTYTPKVERVLLGFVIVLVVLAVVWTLGAGLLALITDTVNDCGSSLCGMETAP